MSRSYRKPYSAICGGDAKPDRIIAARGVRRQQNRYIRQFIRVPNWDEFLIPHRYECPWNNTYCWSRDGKQSLQFPASKHYHIHPWAEEFRKRHLEWWIKLHRK